VFAGFVEAVNGEGVVAAALARQIINGASVAPAEPTSR
jgi:hypothetical protein